MSLLDLFEWLLKLLIICFCLLRAGGAAACSFKAQLLRFWDFSMARKLLALTSSECWFVLGKDLIHTRILMERFNCSFC